MHERDLKGYRSWLTVVSCIGVASVVLFGGAKPSQAQCEFQTGSLVRPTDLGSQDQFATCVGIDGDIAFIGAPRQPSATETGAVYIATHGASWSITQKLVAPDGAPGRRFGSSVAVDGSWAVVGADGGGVAYVYQLVGTTWLYRQKLIPSTSTPGDFFGYSTAISGTTIVIGAYGTASYTGSVFVFNYNGSSWVQSQVLSASDGASYDFFGFDVAISNNVVIVGAYGDDEATGANFGSSHIFRLDGAQWLFQQKLQAPDGGSGDSFGESVDIDGDRVVIGASRDDDAGSNAGAAYLFELILGQWTYVSKLTGSDSRPGDWFGASVAIQGDLVVIGSPLWDGIDGVTNCGAVYPFVFNGTHWNEQSKLIPPAPGGLYDDNLGKSVAVSSIDIVGGANLADWLGRDTGDAYFFDVNCGPSVPTCVVNADCNDSNLCTTDTCSGSGACVFTDNALPCDDGLFCNGTDACNAGSCSVHAGNPCANGASCANTCNETADNCFTAANVACTADTNSCTNDVCNGSGLCTHPNKPAGSACGSSAAGLCDNPDSCSASGVCLANNMVNGTACTDDGNECTNDSCNSGLCTHPARADNTACTPDALPCTSDICTAGICVHPNKPEGSACGSSATSLCDSPDTCNASGVCLANNLANGTACTDDGNECTNDSCNSGLCTHPARADNTACTPDAMPCTSDVCTAGICVHPSKPAGTACGSSSAGLCDNPDRCSATGVCLANNLPNGTTCTDDGNECTSDSCSNGVCLHMAKPDGSPCNDGNICTDSDSCGNGVCTSGVELTCDDSDSCTVDMCLPMTGCYSDPIVCPAGHSCVEGACTSGGQYSCNDGVCDAGEDACNCPGDCLTVAVLCGNGVCDTYAGEDCRSCPDDCRGRLTGPLGKQFCCGDDNGGKPAACASSTCNTRDWACTDSAPPCR